MIILNRYYTQKTKGPRSFNAKLKNLKNGKIVAWAARPEAPRHGEAQFSDFKKLKFCIEIFFNRYVHYRAQYVHYRAQQICPFVLFVTIYVEHVFTVIEITHYYTI